MSILFRVLLLTLHSQITKTFQPYFLNSSETFLSRNLLPWIFLNHQSVFVFGNTKFLHPSCPCQKHPCTNIMVLYLANTISGLPGKSFLCNLYLTPLPNKYLRTINSGFVFFDRIWLILKLLTSLVCTSAILLALLFQYSNIKVQVPGKLYQIINRNSKLASFNF